MTSKPILVTEAASTQRFAVTSDEGAWVRSDPAHGAAHELVPMLDEAITICGVYAGQYGDFADEVRSALVPQGVLEDLLVSRVISTAWRLNEALRACEAGCTLEETYLEDLDAQLGRTIAGFEQARSARRARWGHAVPSETVAVPPPLDLDVPEADDAFPDDLDDRAWSYRGEPSFEDADGLEDEEDTSGQDRIDPSLLWRDRLVIDPEISPTSPIIKGTWITVNHMVSLVVDGWSWADILRTHPEINEDDIRACLTYSVEEEDSALPLEQPAL